MLRLAFVLLEDVHARKGEEGDPHEPEESATQHVQQVEEEPEEKRKEPVGKQDGTDQQEGARGVVGDSSGAEVMGQVGGWGEKIKGETLHQIWWSTSRALRWTIFKAK